MARGKPESPRITPEDPSEAGVLRVEISGGWDLSEFNHLLSSIDQGYRIIHKLQVLKDAARAEREDYYAWFDNQQSRREPESFFADIVLGSYKYFREDQKEKGVPPSTEPALSIADAYITNLRLKSASYSSPGWIEVIGALNPIKVMADMVIGWRQQRIELEMAQLQAETERMRIKKDLMKDMVELLRDMTGNATTASVWTKEVLPQLEKSVLALASDPRVTAVEVQ